MPFFCLPKCSQNASFRFPDYAQRQSIPLRTNWVAPTNGFAYVHVGDSTGNQACIYIFHGYENQEKTYHLHTHRLGDEHILLPVKKGDYLVLSGSPKFSAINHNDHQEGIFYPMAR